MLLALLAVAGAGAGAEERRIARIALIEGRATGPDIPTSPARTPTLVFAAGDSIELRWTSDREALLHLHGYDIEARAGPGGVASMMFSARAAGRFPVEIHGASGPNHVVLYVEIHPK